MKLKSSNSTDALGLHRARNTRRWPFGKTFLIMRITAIIMLVACLQVSAEGFSQQITLHVKNASLEKVFEEIGKQSGYHFFFNERLLKDARKVSVDLQNVTLQQALDACFYNQPFNYVIMEQIVVVKKKDSPEPLRLSVPVLMLIKGKITNEKGEPLPGASIKLRNSNVGTTTNPNGEFTLNVPDNTAVQLEVSMIGYKTLFIQPTNLNNVLITLFEEPTTLDNFVVIGYGTTRRQDFTGSVSSIRLEGSPLAQMPNMNALEALKGNVSGLNIGATNRPGGQPDMLIRGQNSISGNNDPLIVLDGTVFLGSLSDINPNDIASFDILKDATSAAAYGSRSANGVIAITTKKGRLGKPVITFNTTTGWQTWQNEPVMMKGAEWIEVVNARNKYTPGSINWMKPGELANKDAGRETNWLDEVTRTGMIQTYQAAVSGATPTVNYYLSAAYDDNKGIVRGDDFNRMNVLAKLKANVTSWLELGVDGSFSKRDYSGFEASIGEAQTMSPYGVMFRDAEGNLEKYPYTQSAINPLWGVDDGTRDNMDLRNNYRLNANALITVPWVKGLTYRATYLINLNESKLGNFTYQDFYVAEGEGLARYSPATIQGFLSRANGNLERNNTYSYVFDNIINYKNTFVRHGVDVTLVATRDYQRYERINTTGSDFAANGNTTLGMWGLHNSAVQKVVLDGNERANIGYLGRVSYSYNNRYYLTGSFRRDGASVFGANNKWAHFGAVGFAWRISEETFMKKIEPLSNLKLKFSWGQNGNQGIGPYGTLSTVANGAPGGVRYEFSNAPGTVFYGLFQNTLGNADLGWETTESWNAGFESAWLHDRLFVDVDMYVAQTTDQIFTRNIPVMTGFKTIQTSMGQVNNRGLEINIRSVNVQMRNFTWSSGITFWRNRNKLMRLYGEDKNGDGKEDDDLANGLFIGQPLYAIYGYEQIGIVQTDDAEYIALTGAQPGAPKYADIDKSPGITAADRKILGFAQDNFRLSLSNTFTYKDLDLYVMFAGVFGGDNYYLKNNAAAYLTSGTSRFNDNMTSKPYWTPENKSNTYPSAYFSGDGRFLGLQSRGFVRMQDVTLSWRVKQDWLNAARINSAKVFLSGKNPLLPTGSAAIRKRERPCVTTLSRYLPRIPSV